MSVAIGTEFQKNLYTTCCICANFGSPVVNLLYIMTDWILTATITISVAIGTKLRVDLHIAHCGVGETVVDITTSKLRTSTSDLCIRGIDTGTLVTMVGHFLTSVSWHCGMACLAIS